MRKIKLFSLLFLSIGLALVFSSSIPPDCPNEDGEGVTLFPHEDCTKFWKCEHGIAVEKDCPSGLHFSPTLSVCDYPEEARCTGTESGSGSKVSFCYGGKYECYRVYVNNGVTVYFQAFP